MGAQDFPSLRAANYAITGIVIVGLVIVIGKVVNLLWLRPKRLERFLRAQNLKGNSYKLGFGDLKEMSRMIQEAKSKPINLDDDVFPRAFPFQHHIIQKYGMMLIK